MRWRASRTSLCTLEFEIHRPLYEWLINNVDGLPGAPYQREFARLNLTYTVMSKRKLLPLVKEKQGQWVGRSTHAHDQRACAVAAITPAVDSRASAQTVGLTKFNSLTDVALLEHCIREDLNKHALRAYGVLRPIKVVIENYPEGQVEHFEAAEHCRRIPYAGTRQVPLCRELYIDADDFMETPRPGLPSLVARRRGAPEDLPSASSAKRSIKRRRWQHQRTALHLRRRHSPRQEA